MTRSSAHLLAPIWAVFLCLLATACAASGINVDLDFEGSNLATWEEVAPATLDVTIRNDTKNSARRWYSFKVEGARGQDLRVNITNARGASVDMAWPFNQPVVSTDGGETWSRVARTQYEDGTFSFWHEVKSDSEWFALLHPYSFQRWLDLVEGLRGEERVAFVKEIGQSLQGRPVHLVGFSAPGTDPASKPSIWVTARVHPAETGSSWQLEGFIEWLLGDDPQAAELLDQAGVFVVGMLNPDGVALGNYRMDTLGQNLNREWHVEDPAKVPTLLPVKDAMRDYLAAGGDIRVYFDLHCFSAIRANFVYYNDMSNDGIDTDSVLQVMEWVELHEEVNPAFSVAHSDGSMATTPGIAKNWALLELGIPALTYETSYQDIAYHDRAYMTIERYRGLGVDLGRTAAQSFFAIPMTAPAGAEPAVVGQ